MKKSRQSGFTLIEIMVVLAIAAIISSITLGAFRSISEGNRRTSCQTNLSQIYQSCRLYAQDYDGLFPYLNQGIAPDQTATPKGGLGLWSLYTFPKLSANDCQLDSFDLPQTDEYLANNAPQKAPSLAGYIRSPKIFHCPADSYEKDIKFRAVATPNACSPKKVQSDTLTFVDGSETYLNPSFLSYQVTDLDINAPTYSSFRAADIGSDNNTTVPVRQLIPYVEKSSVNSISDRPIRQMTVVTWCRFHRKLDSNTGLTKAGRRNYDNVLFSDGSVQFLPMDQDVSQGTGTSDVCKGAERVPRDKAENMVSATDCVPSP
jgi:prepilin-type N-terminal cleavage/methylation domain-containing protein